MQIIWSHFHSDASNELIVLIDVLNESHLELSLFTELHSVSMCGFCLSFMFCSFVASKLVITMFGCRWTTARRTTARGWWRWWSTAIVVIRSKIIMTHRFFRNFFQMNGCMNCSISRIILSLLGRTARKSRFYTKILNIKKELCINKFIPYAAAEDAACWVASKSILK